MNPPEEMDLARCSVDSRHELVCVSQNCPQIAYLEARIPFEAKRVISVEFTVVSHDQGWADNPFMSLSWFEARVDPCNNRAVSRALEIGRNRSANPDFFEQTWTIDSKCDPLREAWLNFLRPGDVIQLVPMACSLGWVNVVESASMKIRYEASPSKSVNDDSGKDQPHKCKWLPILYAASHNIRVLVIKPGQFAAPIDGFFEVLPLAEASKKDFGFCALSYCWGEASECSEITISLHGDGGKFSLNIPRTVERAIRRLRHSKDGLRIWIDSICINQSDDNEKAEQVNIMGQIYKLADVVHIWLGDRHAVTKMALRTIRDISNFTYNVCPRVDEGKCPCPPGEDHRLSKAKIERLYVESRIGDVYDMHSLEMGASAKELDMLATQNLMDVVERLFDEPWFHRIWVIQEALLARQAIVHCGNQKTRWRELLRVTKDLDCKRATVYSSFDWWGPQWRIWMLPMWHTLDGCLSTLDQPKILELLIGAMDFKATKPRDKLFALYYFGSETSTVEVCDDEIKPNYKKTESQVFADFTRWWIRTNKSLEILSYIHLDAHRTWRRAISRTTIQRSEEEQTNTEKPTWVVPHEGRSKWSKALLINQRWSFSATGDTSPDECLLSSAPDPLRIMLLGHKVSRIGSIKIADDMSVSTIYPAMFGGEYMAFGLRELSRMLGNSICEFTHEMADVFEWIFDPSGLHSRWTHGISLNDYEGILECSHYLQHTETHRRYEKLSDWRKDQLAALTCLDPCFFDADNGLTGLCPLKAREGDVIALLHGAKVPYLLRLVEGGDDEMDHPTDRESAGVYELVGECYVEGIMHGEFMEECQKEGRPPQVFTLV
ncbi:heterokaryon incompatibility protein-domain-containing protein [Phyllosticta capitalensis]